MPTATASGSYVAVAAPVNTVVATDSGSYVAVAANANVVTATTSGSYVAVAANTGAPFAGVDQVNVEPFATVTLTATDTQGVPAWSQIGGAAVTLLGSGAVRTFVAPATRAGTVLTFRATDPGGLTDDMTVTVLPHNEWAPIGGVEVPLRILAVAP